jgi:hypothetical protein
MGFLTGRTALVRRLFYGGTAASTWLTETVQPPVFN